MNRAEFFKKIDKTLTKGIKEIHDMWVKYNERESAMNSGKYAKDYIVSKIMPELTEKRLERQNAIKEVEKSFDATLAEYKKSLELMDTLNPADITEDAKLFDLGMLNQRDLEAILERNQKNRTMTMLVFRYAEEHGIQLTGNYIPAQTFVNEAMNLVYSANIILKWADTETGADSIYERVFTEEMKNAWTAEEDDCSTNPHNGNGFAEDTVRPAAL